LNFCAAAVNDLVKIPGMAPSVGILVLRVETGPTVRLDGPCKPIAVTSYTYETLPDKECELPPSRRSRLPWNKGPWWKQESVDDE
jgi:hypothetical protein